MDIIIPYDENLVKAERGKRVKYLDLADEVRPARWRMASTEIIDEWSGSDLRCHLQRLGLLHGPVMGAIQKAILLDNVRIVRRFLSPPT